MKKTNEQQNRTNQYDYSQFYHNLSSKNLEGNSRQQLKIVAIPPPQRKGRAFFRIIDDSDQIIADQLSDYAKAQVYFEEVGNA